MNTFHLEIVTPDGPVFSGEAESLLVHTVEGDLEILAGHMEMAAAVGIGRARIIADGKDRLGAVSGGLLSVVGGEVKLAAVTFEFKEDIDLLRAEKSRLLAEEKIKNAKDNLALDSARAKLERAIARINIASK